MHAYHNHERFTPISTYTHTTAQRQSFSYFPPDSRRSTGGAAVPPTRPSTYEDPAGHRLSMQLPGVNGGVKQEGGPKMVRHSS